jgi:hypothetical protein
MLQTLQGPLHIVNMLCDGQRHANCALSKWSMHADQAAYVADLAFEPNNHSLHGMQAAVLERRNQCRKLPSACYATRGQAGKLVWFSRSAFRSDQNFASEVPGWVWALMRAWIASLLVMHLDKFISSCASEACPKRNAKYALLWLIHGHFNHLSVTTPFCDFFACRCCKSKTQDWLTGW